MKTEIKHFKMHKQYFQNKKKYMHIYIYINMYENIKII